MTKVSFIVEGKPYPQGSMIATRYGKMRHKPELVEWRYRVLGVALSAARAAGIVEPIDEPVRITAVFKLPRPKRSLFGLPAVKPDLDKLQRAIGDALAPSKGIGILKEDSRIVEWHATKIYKGDPAGNEIANEPDKLGVEVTVENIATT